MANQLPDQELPLSAEPKPKIHRCASCSLAFSSQKFLSQHVQCNHPSQTLLRPSERHLLQPEDPCPGNQHQRYSEPHSPSDKPEGQEAKDRPQALLKSIRLKSISRASSYSSRGQMGGSVVHERMTDKPSTSQKLNPEDTGTLFMSAGVSGITRVMYREGGQAPRTGQVSPLMRGHTQGRSPMFAGSAGEASVTGHILSYMRGHTQGRGPMFAGSVGEASVRRPISSHTTGHTQGRSPMFAGSVGEASVRCQILSHTSGHTLGRSPTFAGTVGEASIGSPISSDTRGHTQGRSPMFAGSVSES